MNELLFAAATGVPMAAGWSLHASRLARRIEVLETPVETAGLVLDVSASIGAVGAHPRTEQVVLSDLLRLADEQMYRAKRCEAPWSNALSLEKKCPTVRGRRAGRSGTHGGTGVAA
ncbi:GGDEF domain-containing protein [Streptomyces sp. NBC_00647]|uniref:diguanylate cyclase domain-containing protein n=1 Tax=Streptomyces sp. NBC_00647 TaxID=2975796 RepID=UPI0032526E35